MDSIKIIFTLIGTYIGAGFISGNEINIFFAQYGVYGIAGLIISSAFIGIVLYKIIIFCKKENIKNYNYFLKKIINKKYRKIVIKIINIYFLLLFCLMISGFCNFINQQYKINKIIIYLIFILFNLFFINNEINFIFKINTIIIPIILLFFIIILFKIRPNINLFVAENKSNFFIPAILYSSFNLISLIPIIINNLYKINKNKIIEIIFLFSIIIFLLGIIILLLINNIDKKYLNLDFPIIKIIENIGIIYKKIYYLIIALAIVTTALSIEYDYIQEDKNKIKYLIFFSFFSINFTFSNLLKIIYPIFGCIGFFQIILFIKYKKNTSL